MASRNKIIEMIGAIKAVYPYYSKDGDAKVLVQTWEALLKPYEDSDIVQGFYNALQVCKMPPTPADVIEKIKEVRRASEPSGEELWATYRQALEKTLRLMGEFGYTFVEEDGLTQGDKARNKVEELWRGLPWQIKAYLSSKSEMMAMARRLDREEITFEQNRFLKALPTLEKRNEYLDGRLALTAGEETRMLRETLGKALNHDNENRRTALLNALEG